jgi:hypothetical protein
VLDGTRTVRRVVTELTSLDEQMLHDVDLARGVIEVCTAWRGDRAGSTDETGRRDLVTFETIFVDRRKTPETWKT